MNAAALQRTTTWAEDRALLGSGHRPKGGPSADPGAKTGDGATQHRPTPFFPLISGIGTKAQNPTRSTLAHSCRRSFQLANAEGRKFQFAVNQDKPGHCTSRNG
jgi:hypothetical protein